MEANGLCCTVVLQYHKTVVHILRRVANGTAPQLAATACLHMQDRLKLIDMVLEVRDARIPFSSANPELEELVRHKRRLIVLNKADLAAPDKLQVVITNVLHVSHTHGCAPAVTTHYTSCQCMFVRLPLLRSF